MDGGFWHRYSHITDGDEDLIEISPLKVLGPLGLQVVADIVLAGPILAQMRTSLELESLKIGKEVFQRCLTCD